MTAIASKKWRDTYPERASATQIRYAETHPEIKRAKERRRRERNREAFARFMSELECEYCGSRERLEFHHRDPKEKVYAVTIRVGNWTLKTLMLEIAKCDIICHRCHVAHHALRQRVDYEPIILTPPAVQ